MAHGTRGVSWAVVDTGNVVAEVVVPARTVARTMTVMVVVMVMMVIVRMIPVIIVPCPMIAIPMIRVVGAVPIVIIIPGVVPVIVIVPRVVITTYAYIYIGGASVIAGAAGVIVVIIVQGGAGSCAETLDTSRIIGVIIGLGGGVNHAVGVSHGLSGLINRLRVGHVILAVAVISLVVVSGTASGRCHGAAIAASLCVAAVVGRIVSVVVSRSLA